MEEEEQLFEDAGERAADLNAPSESDGAQSKIPSAKPKAVRPKSKDPLHPNNVRRIRTEIMLSKAEVARRANISVLTLDRVERGFGCRVDTKRKILEALGLTLADRVRVFGEEE